MTQVVRIFILSNLEKYNSESKANEVMKRINYHLYSNAFIFLNSMSLLMILKVTVFPKYPKKTYLFAIHYFVTANKMVSNQFVYTSQILYLKCFISPKYCIE